MCRVEDQYELGLLGLLNPDFLQCLIKQCCQLDLRTPQHNKFCPFPFQLEIVIIIHWALLRLLINAVHVNMKRTIRNIGN